jgi:DNA-directed RNA polymerase specialized sigma24 family protein
MRRVRQWVDPARLAVYEGIIELYAPYVLIRCARYTNRRRQAQQIGAYTLITTCLVAGKLGQVEQLGRVVDIVLGVVGPDVVSRGPGDLWCGACDELLIVDQRMRKMAAALNSLKRPWREVLVLHYVSGMEPDDLTRLLQEPAAEVTAKIRRAERLLAKRLDGLYGKGDKAGAPDIPSLLTQFAAALDAGWIREVADCALDFLAAPAERPRQRHRCRDWD